jgi:dihydrofolate reductase
VRVCLIVAADRSEVIGRDGGLPWHLPEDLRRFRRLTTGHVVVAGRRTHDSIVARLGHPLPGRVTVVATRKADRRSHGSVIYQPDVASALAVARAVEAFAGGDRVFVIGGAEVYAHALPDVDEVLLTRIDDDVSGDVRLPEGWLTGFELVDRQEPEEPAEPRFSFLTYERG